MSRPRWYLKDIKTKTNREWTTAEKKKVYTLRKKEKLTSLEIAKKLGVEVIQVYNITRIVNKAYKKQCFVCGRKLSKRDLKKNEGRFIKACSKCKNESKEYKKERRKKALKKGLCAYCETEKVIPGRTACKKCISATYRRRYILNLCGRCGKNPIKDKSTSVCSCCSIENNKRTEISRKRKNQSKVKV